ncbi:MAG: hypothetical protein GY696_08010 [Gammaproteobacteria bacterium]|nr:hypothetical protein [Gammaproteobacteria bacterium]
MASMKIPGEVHAVFCRLYRGSDRLGLSKSRMGNTLRMQRMRKPEIGRRRSSLSEWDVLDDIAKSSSSSVVATEMAKLASGTFALRLMEEDKHHCQEFRIQFPKE